MDYPALWGTVSVLVQAFLLGIHLRWGWHLEGDGVQHHYLSGCADGNFSRSL